VRDPLEQEFDVTVLKVDECDHLNGGMKYIQPARVSIFIAFR
jgi:hypothetical protein